MCEEKRDTNFVVNFMKLRNQVGSVNCCVDQLLCVFFSLFFYVVCEIVFNTGLLISADLRLVSEDVED